MTQQGHQQVDAWKNSPRPWGERIGEPMRRNLHKPLALSRLMIVIAVLAALVVLGLMTLFPIKRLEAQGRSYSTFQDRANRFQDRRPAYDHWSNPRQRSARAYPGETLSRQQRICQHYERLLASNWVAGRRPNYELPKIEEEIAQLDESYNKLRAQADRHKCYTDFFIFGKQLRNTRRCRRLDKQIKRVEQRLARLQAKRKAMLRPREDTSRRAEIIRKLAQNRCGAQYEREAKRYSFFWWGDDSSYDNESGYGAEISPYATYRTMCVRLCDGYYFPISFSTLPSRFPQDDMICQQKCAAPAQLFIYRNPGEDIENMISWEGAIPYQSLENAYRYRRTIVKGCSCKPSEYNPALLAAGPDAQMTADKEQPPSPPSKSLKLDESDLQIGTLPKRQDRNDKSPATKVN